MGKMSLKTKPTVELDQYGHVLFTCKKIYERVHTGALDFPDGFSSGHMRAHRTLMG